MNKFIYHPIITIISQDREFAVARRIRWKKRSLSGASAHGRCNFDLADGHLRVCDFPSLVVIREKCLDPLLTPLFFLSLFSPNQAQWRLDKSWAVSFLMAVESKKNFSLGSQPASRSHMVSRPSVSSSEEGSCAVATRETQEPIVRETWCMVLPEAEHT